MDDRPHERRDVIAEKFSDPRDDVETRVKCEPGAFDFVSSLTGWMREGLDEAGRDAALAALRTTIAAHTGDHGVTYQSATWIIQAHKP